MAIVITLVVTPADETACTALVTELLEKNCRFFTQADHVHLHVRPAEDAQELEALCSQWGNVTEREQYNAS